MGDRSHDNCSCLPTQKPFPRWQLNTSLIPFYTHSHTTAFYISITDCTQASIFARFIVCSNARIAETHIMSTYNEDGHANGNSALGHAENAKNSFINCEVSNDKAPPTLPRRKPRSHAAS
jgi:hypothetical protein